MISFRLLDYIHDAVYPEKWIEVEEWLCNFLTDYGFGIFRAAYKIVGENAWDYVIPELENFAS